MNQISVCKISGINCQKKQINQKIKTLYIKKTYKKNKVKTFKSNKRLNNKNNITKTYMNILNELKKITLDRQKN